MATKSHAACATRGNKARLVALTGYGQTKIERARDAGLRFASGEAGGSARPGERAQHRVNVAGLGTRAFSAYPACSTVSRRLWKEALVAAGQSHFAQAPTREGHTLSA